MTTPSIEQLKYINDKIFKNIKQNIIFIYTPPKVGSTTLVTTLRMHLIKTHNIMHIHDNTMLNYLINEPNNTVTINDIIKYNACCLKKNVYVINVYRTLVERKLSEFFEKMAPLHFNNTEQQLVTYPLNKIIKRFNSIFSHIENGDHYFTQYGIPSDSMATTFDHAAGYVRQDISTNIAEHQGTVHYILLRLKDANTLWGGILSGIFNCSINIINDYETINKPFGGLYSKIKKEYKLPVNFMAYIEDCPYLKFYYSENDRIEYITQWTYKLSPTPVIPFTAAEYEFYLQICLENQYIVDYQLGREHYKDEGCECVGCMNRRGEVLKKGNGVVRHKEVMRKRIERIKGIEIKPLQPSLKLTKTLKHIIGH